MQHLSTHSRHMRAAMAQGQARESALRHRVRMRRALAGKIWQEWHLIHNILKGEYPWIACNDFGGSVYYLSEPLLQRINVVKG
jgi:hypothetical protein